MQSILNTIKKLLGLEPNYNAFDTDIIVHINSAFMVLQQLGVGPPKGFTIANEDQTWDEFLTNDQNVDLEAVKTFIYLKVKIVFDPPTSSFVMEAMKQMISEYEWRLDVQVENNQNS